MRRMMAFIDGTNLLTEMAKQYDLSFSPYNPSELVIQLATLILRKSIAKMDTIIAPKDVVTMQRAHWFSSHQGTEETMIQLRSWLRNRRFEPTILRKNKDKNKKGVDVSLTREMLINAFNHNYDVAILVSGDEDYIGLVNDTKRFGPLVYGSFFESGLSPELRLSFDYFEKLEIWADGYDELIKKIKAFHSRPRKG